MKKLISSLCTFFVLFSIQAQPDPIGNFNKHVVENWTEQYIRVSQYMVKGSVYLLGESFTGKATLTSGVLVGDQKIFYDVYNQKVGFDINKQFVKPDADILSFFILLPEKFGGEKLEFIAASTLPKVDTKGFFNLVSDGPKYVFLKQYKSRVVPDPSNLYSKDLRIFEQYYDYFIYDRKTANIEKVRLKAKDVLNALSGAGDAYADKYDLSTATGIKQLVDLLNNK